MGDVSRIKGYRLFFSFTQHKLCRNSIGNTVDVMRNMPRPRFGRSHLTWDLLPRGFDTVKPKVIKRNSVNTITGRRYLYFIYFRLFTQHAIPKISASLSITTVSWCMASKVLSMTFSSFSWMNARLWAHTGITFCLSGSVATIRIYCFWNTKTWSAICRKSYVVALNF